MKRLAIIVALWPSLALAGGLFSHSGMALDAPSGGGAPSGAVTDNVCFGDDEEANFGNTCSAPHYWLVYSSGEFKIMSDDCDGAGTDCEVAGAVDTFNEWAVEALASNSYVDIDGFRFTSDGDGAITMLGNGNGNDETLSLNLDDTANTGVYSSGSGLDHLAFTSISLQPAHIDMDPSTIAADDTTPDVSGNDAFVTSANVGATAITDLDNPVVGTEVEICGGSSTNASTISPTATNFSLLAGAITFSLDVCAVFRVQGDNDYVEISRNSTGVNIQTFTAGAGSYTWYAPRGKSVCHAVLFSAGHGGASGGFDTSDSGGGGGSAGAVAFATFPVSAGGTSLTVTLGAGGVGGAQKSAAGDGNAPSAVPGASSLGTILAVTPTTTGDPAGGTNAVGTGGAVENAWTTMTAAVYITGNAGGDGDDAAAPTSPSATVFVPYGPFGVMPPVGGSGAGGTNGGANFTRGAAGASQKAVSINSTAAAVAAGQVVVAATTQAANTDGADGVAGAAGSVTGQANGSLGYTMLIGGEGATGASGAVVLNASGGAGKNGGNCGGGGSGSGSAKAGSGHSGTAGNGGPACLYVACS